MHTVDKSLSVTPEEVLDLILFAHHYFSETECWFESRRGFLEKIPVNSMESIQDDDNYECYILQSLLIEFRISIEVLKPAQIQLYLNFDKKLKSIHCPNCSHKVSKMDFWDHEFIHDCGKTYQKINNSNAYSCRICNHTGSILNKQCSEYECESKSIDSELGICLTCFGENAL